MAQLKEENGQLKSDYAFAMQQLKERDDYFHQLGDQISEYTKGRKKDEWRDNLRLYLMKVSDVDIYEELPSVC